MKMRASVGANSKRTNIPTALSFPIKTTIHFCKAREWSVIAIGHNHLTHSGTVFGVDCNLQHTTWGYLNANLFVCSIASKGFPVMCCSGHHFQIHTQNCPMPVSIWEIVLWRVFLSYVCKHCTNALNGRALQLKHCDDSANRAIDHMCKRSLFMEKAIWDKVNYTALPKSVSFEVHLNRGSHGGHWPDRLHRTMSCALQTSSLSDSIAAIVTTVMSI